MKKQLLTLLLMMAGLMANAQERTTMATLYREFKPSVIYLTNGRQLKQELTNVFLKNSTLVYLQGTYTMEAKMSNISRVEFEDRSFEVIEEQLATVVDTIGNDCIYLKFPDEAAGEDFFVYRLHPLLVGVKSLIVGMEFDAAQRSSSIPKRVFEYYGQTAHGHGLGFADGR